MKTIKVLLLLLLTLCFSNASHAFEDENYYPEVKQESPLIRHIIKSEEGVFLQIGDGWILTEGLQASAEGIFVIVNGEYMTVEAALENSECVRKTWVCKKCGFINYDGIAACALCGKPRYEK